MASVSITGNDWVAVGQSLSAAAAAAPTPPSEPGAPTLSLTGSQGSVVGNMDAAHLVDLYPAILTQASSTKIVASGSGGLGFTLTGSGFSYDNNGWTPATAAT